MAVVDEVNDAPVETVVGVVVVLTVGAEVTLAVEVDAEPEGSVVEVEETVRDAVWIVVGRGNEEVVIEILVVVVATTTTAA